MLERFNRIYPNSKFVHIPAYNPELWKDRPYDSKFDNKAAINKWKTSPLSYEEAATLVEEGERIGWIVPKGFVVVDVDNKEDGRTQEYLEKLLKKFEVAYNYNYTSKGIHILFEDPSEEIKSDAKCKTSLNLVIDTRANGTGYIVLPCNDPHREWGRWNDFVEEIPYFMKPALKDDSPSFIGMQEGDGRNNALFKWRSKLMATHKFTPVEIEKSIRIINENLFDTGIPNNELFKTVLRDLSTKTPKVIGEAKENRYNQIAEDFIGKFDVISFGINLYKFNGIYYKQMTQLELERMIHYEVSKDLSKSARNEIVNFIILKTQVSMEEFDKDWYKIACGNGILNLVTGEVTAPTKNDVNTIWMPWEYDPDPPPSPRIDQFMKDICNGDLIKIQFLYQVAGYCLLKKNMFEKFFIFRGEGGTGKSTFMNLMHKLVGGDQNCSHIGLQDFDKDYFLASTISKLLNIDDDAVDGKTLESTGRFKSFISGNAISVRQIYKEVVSFIPYATCVFSCNRLPKIMDKTTGLMRRMVLVELNHKVQNPDPLFMNKITTMDMQYFLFKAVEGIKVAIEEGRFKIMHSEKQLLAMFRRRQSALNEWLFDNTITIGDLHMKRTLPLYKQFCEWCVENGYNKVPSHLSFKEEICHMYDIDVDLEGPVTNTAGVAKPQIFIKRGMFDTTFRPF